MRLYICLFQLCRGDYYYTFAEVAGLEEATVSNIIRNVSNVIVERLWEGNVGDNIQRDKEQLRVTMEEMEQELEFPCSYAAIDDATYP